MQDKQTNNKERLLANGHWEAEMSNKWQCNLQGTVFIGPKMSIKVHESRLNQSNLIKSVDLWLNLPC